MNPIAWLLGLALPACGFPAAQGLPTPPPMDTARIERPASSNTALAAPQGSSPPPDIVSPVYAVPPNQLFMLVQKVAADQLRTFIAAIYPDRLQVHYVVRSAVMNAPDLLTAQVSPNGPDGSSLILYSRSVYGYSDLGVNRKRVEAWLGALRSLLPPARER